MGERKCSVEGCERNAKNVGLCGMHYQRKRTHGSTDERHRHKRPTCSVVGCWRPHEGRGYCARHLYRFHKHGSPTAGRAERGVGLQFLVSNSDVREDRCIIWPFGVGGHGYGCVDYEGVATTAPRAMCAMAHGKPIFEGADVAHECGNRLCVAPAHLRWDTRAGNLADKRAHGTHLEGERMVNAKLTDDLVRKIRAGSLSDGEWSRLIGVSSGTIRKARTRLTWKHID